MTLVTLAVGWLLTLPPSPNSVPASEPQWLDALVPNPTPVTMAFLGAYFFSVQMLFRRYVRRDLRGSAYVAVVLRVVLAVIGTWVVVEIADGAGWASSNWQLLTAGFVIGVFPKVAWQIVRSVFAKLWHKALPSMESRLPLSELDGLTVWHEARLGGGHRERAEHGHGRSGGPAPSVRASPAIGSSTGSARRFC